MISGAGAFPRYFGCDQPEQDSRAMPRLQTIVVAAIVIGAAKPTAPHDFGSVTVPPGEMQVIQIITTGRLRVCNDWNSVGIVEVTIVPRDARTLQPGECTEHNGWEIKFRNLSASPARMFYRGACPGPICNH
jgi:hypothetical protein